MDNIKGSHNTRKIYDKISTKSHHEVLEGDKAHSFDMPSQLGKNIVLKDFKGKYLVLYFYPKDDTPGCTLEGGDFSCLVSDFEKCNACVVGVSKDNIASHIKFAEKYDLKFPLGSDEDLSVSKKYGVYKEKNMYGKKVMGIERTTFLIDPEGVVSKVWRKVNAKGHASDVLETLKNLSKK